MPPPELDVDLVKLVQPAPPRPRQRAKAGAKPMRKRPPRGRGIAVVVAMVTTSTPQIRQQAGPSATHVSHVFAQNSANRLANFRIDRFSPDDSPNFGRIRDLRAWPTAP